MKDNRLYIRVQNIYHITFLCENPWKHLHYGFIRRIITLQCWGLGLITSLKVSDRLLCSIAAGFIEECRGADSDLAENLESSELLLNLAKQSKTKHENNSNKAFQRAGLAAPIEISMVDVGFKYKLPILKVTHFMQTLADHGKLPLLWGSRSLVSRTDILPKFWRRFRGYDPEHTVFAAHGQHLDRVLPLQLHADEGQTLKKSAVMVVAWQSPLGFGTSVEDDVEAAMHLNFIGNSYATRFLLGVCTKKTYQKKKGHVLDCIIDILAKELYDLFHDGIWLSVGNEKVQFWVATLGLKGDWPIQARLGHLERHFARKGVYQVSSATSGFCHLCRAGELNVPPFEYHAEAKWRDTYLTSTPWSRPGPLCQIPPSPRKEFFHKFDIFHCLHKGCFAELAGSAIVTGLFVGKLF